MAQTHAQKTSTDAVSRHRHCNCVRKPKTHDAGRKRRRGTPREYSDSWVKKLILLRECGWSNSQAIHTLRKAASTRTAQTWVQALLAHDGKRYISPNREIARQRVKFLNRVFKTSAHWFCTKSVVNLLNEHRTVTSASHPNADRVRHGSTTQLQTESSLTIQMPEADGDHEKCVAAQEPFISYSEEGSCHISKPAIAARIETTATSSREESKAEQDKEAAGTSLVLTRVDDDVTKTSKETRRRSQNRLSWLSTNSAISAYSSLVDKMSLLSFSTLCSDSKSIDGFTSTKIAPTAAVIVQQRRDFNHDANSALFRLCCGRIINHKPVNCIHQMIAGMIPLDSPFIGQDNRIAMYADYKMRKGSWDAYGNNELFYAARVGVTAGLLMSIASRSPALHTLNADGQSFLFHLNPIRFVSEVCVCHYPSDAPHDSSFECVIRFLEKFEFHFEALDIHGRHFLSYLCSYDCFDIQWLYNLAFNDDVWLQRVRRLANIRDSAGLFLNDFMVLNSTFYTRASISSRSHSPMFYSEMTNTKWTRSTAWGNETEHDGQTDLHRSIVQLTSGNTLSDVFTWGDEQDLRQFIARCTSRDSLPHAITEWGHTELYINRYDLHGRTPMMDFFEAAVSAALPPHMILSRLDYLMQLGANINACTHNGTTLLHYAVKKLQVEVVQFLLQRGIEHERRDELGYTALDYAEKIFTRSRARKIEPRRFAQSLKAMMLLSKDGQMAQHGKDYRSDVSRRSGNICEALAASATATR